MEKSPSIESFVSDWIGRYYVGRTFVVWCHGPTLGGTVYWGRPNLEDAAALARLYSLPVSPDGPPFDLVSDGARLDSVTADVFAAFVPVARRIVELKLRRHALVMPQSGRLSAVVAGAIPVAGANHAWQLFGDAASAFGWLERPDAAIAAAQVQSILDRERPMLPLARQLQLFLKANLLAATLRDAARGLGVSARTLQRELAAGGTSFQRQLDEARVAAATDLVHETDLKLEAIAISVGLSSAATLNDVFRRVGGVTPGQLRASRRERARSTST